MKSYTNFVLILCLLMTSCDKKDVEADTKEFQGDPKEMEELGDLTDLSVSGVIHMRQFDIWEFDRSRLVLKPGEYLQIVTLKKYGEKFTVIQKEIFSDGYNPTPFDERIWRELPLIHAINNQVEVDWDKYIELPRNFLVGELAFLIRIGDSGRWRLWIPANDELDFANKKLLLVNPTSEIK